MLLLLSLLATDRSKFPANDRFHGLFRLLSIQGTENCHRRPSSQKKEVNYLSLHLRKLIVLLIVFFLGGMLRHFQVNGFRQFKGL